MGHAHQSTEGHQDPLWSSALLSPENEKWVVKSTLDGLLESPFLSTFIEADFFNNCFSREMMHFLWLQN